MLTGTCHIIAVPLTFMTLSLTSSQHQSAPCNPTSLQMVRWM